MKKAHTFARVMFGAWVAMGALAACSGAKEGVLVGDADGDAGRDARVVTDDGSGTPDGSAAKDAGSHPGDAGGQPHDAGAANDATTGKDASLGQDGGACPYDVGPLGAFVPPRAQQPGACSHADIALIGAAENDPNATPASIYASLAASPSCQSCLYSNAVDASWQLFVWQPDAASGQAIFNQGACTADSPGAHPGCADAMQKLALCFDQACPASCGGAANQACVEAANNGTCHAYADQFHFQCSNADVLHCGHLQTAAAWLCGPAVVGGGGGDAG